MSIGVLFWIILIVWALWGGYSTRKDPAGFGPALVMLVLLGLLGWAQFGSPVR